MEDKNLVEGFFENVIKQGNKISLRESPKNVSPERFNNRETDESLINGHEGRLTPGEKERLIELRKLKQPHVGFDGNLFTQQLSGEFEEELVGLELKDMGYPVRELEPVSIAELPKKEKQRRRR